MADIEKMKINLVKNEEKLAKKVALLSKYENKKAKLLTQWEKLYDESFSDSMKKIYSLEDDLSVYEKIIKYYGEKAYDIYDKIDSFVCDKSYINPIVQTQNGIKELEARIQKYRDSIAEEEKKVVDRNANIEANSMSVNGKNVNVIMEFLDKWENKTTTYYMEMFNRFVKEHKSYYAEHVENSIEYIIVFHKTYENRNRMNELWANSVYVEFYPTYTDYEKATDKKDCYNAINKELNDKIEAYESAFGIKIIEKWGKSKWYPNEEMFEVNMRKDVAEEKNRKYDQLIKDVEKICGKIIDMTNIKVGAKGDLEGYVIGEKGECELWTTGCGGWNEGVIVNVKHGQKFHFRFYVRKRA